MEVNNVRTDTDSGYSLVSSDMVSYKGERRR